MKHKIYYVLYSLIQVFFGVYTAIYAPSIVEGQLDSIKEAFKTISPELGEQILKMFEQGSLVTSTRVFAVVSVVIALILLFLIFRNKLLQNRGLVIGLLIASLFTGNDLTLILAVVFLILFSKEDKDVGDAKIVKEKLSVKKLEMLPTTGRDYVWAAVLVLAYCTQFFASAFINTAVVAIIYEVIFRIVVLALVIYVFFKEIKQGLNEFKKDFKTHLKYAFKWWGIMLAFSMIAAIIRMIAGAAEETANQAALNSLPLLYLLPMTIIWAPIVEEAMFRGVLRRFVKNDTLFVILSAVMFGLLHTVGSEVGLYNILIQSLQYVVMGGVFAYVYTKTNNICINMLMHSIQNTLGMIVIIIGLFL